MPVYKRSIPSRLPAVVLIHGIWLNGQEMALIRHRLRKAGLSPYQFSYPSVRQSLRRNARKLQRFLKTLSASEVHFIAHSLGGLLVRHLFAEFPDQRPGRIVTLGTPHGGSFVAQRLNRSTLGRQLLGASLANGLLGDVPAWQSDHSIGVIAGNTGVGIGMLFPRLSRPNDGTVALSETELPGAADYAVLPVSHMQLLISKQVADFSIEFLRDGHFTH